MCYVAFVSMCAKSKNIGAFEEKPKAYYVQCPSSTCGICDSVCVYFSVLLLFLFHFVNLKSAFFIFFCTSPFFNFRFLSASPDSGLLLHVVTPPPRFSHNWLPEIILVQRSGTFINTHERERTPDWDEETESGSKKWGWEKGKGETAAGRLCLVTVCCWFWL